MMTGFLLDLLLVAVLAFCVWQGYRKGLILTVAGVLMIFLAAFLAGKVASTSAQPVSERLHPIMGWVTDDAIGEATRGKGRINELTDMTEIAGVAEDTFSQMGISGSEIAAMVEKVLQALTGTEQTLRETIEVTALYVASYALIALFSFILFMVGLTLLVHFIAAVFKLPVLNIIDKVGGLAAGLLYGILILCAVGWAMRYAGIFSNTGIVENTTILRFFVNHNMLAGLLSLRPESLL
jgi:uncharacterized membrane protein required for colicin V production